ncbi:MAG: hypothetical protein ACSLEN_11865 [Candidatus Malihini olakiniferum]
MLYLFNIGHCQDIPSSEASQFTRGAIKRILLPVTKNASWRSSERHWGHFKPILSLGRWAVDAEAWLQALNNQRNALAADA